MSKVTKSKVIHKDFGNCLEITNGLIRLLVTLDFGPRVIHFSLIDKENMFYEDPSREPIGEGFEIFGGEPLRLCGGHRLWISPEVMPRCYYPDGEPVKFTQKGDEFIFTAAVEDVNLIQKSISITLDEDKPYVTLGHTIRNCGNWEVELAPWSITMMAAGGQAIIPMPNTETGYLPNRIISLWDYSMMNDPRVYWGNKYILLNQDTTNSRAFKLGINNEAGWAACRNKGQLFIKFFEPDAEAVYPDNGCCCESYTNDKFIEIETLGELCLIEPGDSVTHTEEWELYEAGGAQPEKWGFSEDEIDKLLSPYIV